MAGRLLVSVIWLSVVGFEEPAAHLDSACPQVKKRACPTIRKSCTRSLPCAVTAAMALNALLALLGVSLAAMTLRDVFDTVVVPGGSRASLRVAQRIGTVMLPVWKAIRGRRRGLSGSFAPVVLFASFVVWFALLALGFGLMAYAARSQFQPRLESLPEAIYTVGSAMTTVGPGKAETVLGVGRWILLGASFCGLAVMTMAVTYFLQVQSSIGARDAGIIKLNTSAGDPPSALTMLERFAALRYRGQVRDVLVESRNWCATVRQSHSAHPTLIYFQSVGNRRRLAGRARRHSRPRALRRARHRR